MFSNPSLLYSSTAMNFSDANCSSQFLLCTLVPSSSRVSAVARKTQTLSDSVNFFRKIGTPVTTYIFSYLPIKELCKIASTSSGIKHSCENPALWIGGCQAKGVEIMPKENPKNLLVREMIQEALTESSINSRSFRKNRYKLIIVQHLYHYELIPGEDVSSSNLLRHYFQIGHDDKAQLPDDYRAGSPLKELLLDHIPDDEKMRRMKKLIDTFINERMENIFQNRPHENSLSYYLASIIAQYNGASSLFSGKDHLF